VYAAGFGVLVALSLGGDLIARTLKLAVPGPVLGLAAYSVLMALVPAVERLTAPAARLMLGLLGALIVPAAVGLAAFAPAIREAVPALTLVLVVSTVVTGLTTALLYAGLKR
jgi:putative effector of murein hydrolase LrgA (UPF0299 family)